MALGACALMLLGAASASAANRFAEVGGDGEEPCLVSDPCSIESAINAALSGDDVTLLGGQPPSTYVTSTPLVVPSNVTVHGTPGALAVVNSNGGNSAPAVTLAAGSILRDVDVEHTGVNFPAVRLNGGGTMERVIAHASGGSTPGGCQTEGGGSPIIRDSICWHDQVGGANGGGVQGRNDTVTAQTLTLRNVTAVTSNARPGVQASQVSGGAVTINATNVIAQSASGPDVGYTAGFTPAAIVLDHSNYDTEADPNNVITSPGMGTANQTTPPAFVNAAAGDFHQLPTSVGTIDLGAAQLMGELDFEGQPRTIGAAPDIGADELRNPTTTAVACDPPSLTFGVGSSTCRATVTDTGSSPTNPTGSVSFTSNGSGTFSGTATCSLLGNAGQPSCQVTYTPTAVGTGSHQITASYPGDSTHEPSQGSTTVGVQAPAGPGLTTPAFNLKAAIKKCKKKFPKGPKRKKCIKRAKKRALA